MALLDTSKAAFSSGELGPRMVGRHDVDRYRHGATLLENWMVLPQGGVTRRPGTRYVATVKDPTKLTILKPFEASTSAAYILEIGHEYMRFYKDGAQIQNPPATAVEIATPWPSTALRELRTAQANDLMLFVHPSYAPRRLARLSDTSWELRLFPFDPPALWEAGDAGGPALTLGSAAPGTTTLTSTVPVWYKSDVNRMLTAGAGRALLLTYTTNLVMQVRVLDAFPSTTIAANTWRIEGSPWTDVDPSEVGTVGGTILLTYGVAQPAETELMVTAFGAWTDYSGNIELLLGEHTGANDSLNLLEDANHDFVAAGVLPTQIVHNQTDGSSGVISSVSPHALGISGGLFGGTENDFDNTDNYSVTETGASRVSGGVLELHGGTAGHGWREVAITTTAGNTYQVTFSVVQAAVSVQLGDAIRASNLYPEASYPPGDHVLVFTASGATAYLQFRNNQNYWAGISRCSVKQYTIETRASANVGKYVELHGGLVQLLAVSGTGHSARVLRELTSADPAPAGAWRLLSPAWSDSLGWPSAVVLYEGRLFFAGSARFPQTIWGSAIDDFLDFGLGPNADMAVEFSLVDSGGNITLNRLRWLMPAENMLTGTSHGEYRLVGAGDDPLSATSPPRMRIQSTFGSDGVQPLKVGPALLFAQRQGSKLREMSYDERTQTTFIARDITVTSDHLLRTYRILEMAYQQEPLSIVWAVRSDGQLLGLTYDLSEQILAWWRVVTAGSVESVATIPHPTTNAHQVWVTVQRTIGGVATRTIEVFEPTTAMLLPTAVTLRNGLTGVDESVASWQGLTLDCAKLYASLNSNTVTGLTHLVGATVSLVGDGAVFPAQVVPAGGALTLPQVCQTVWVGLPFTSRLRCLPLDVPVRGTTSQGLRKRLVRIVTRVEGTACLVVQGERVSFRTPAMPMDQGIAPFSGDVTAQPLGWDTQAAITCEVDQPLPSTVLGFFILLDQEVEGR